LFDLDAHVEVEATWQMYQRTVAAYREPDRAKARAMMAALITTLSNRRTEAADRTDRPWVDPEETGRRRAGLLRPTRHQQRPDRWHHRRLWQTPRKIPSV